MKRLVLIFVFLFCAVAVAYSSEDDVQWQSVAPNSFINTDGIMGLEDIYGFSFMLKSFNKGQYEPVMGKPVWYTISQYTIDCSKQTYKIGVIDSYGYEDNFVNGDYNRYAKFQPIVHGTAVSAVYSKLCRIK